MMEGPHGPNYGDGGPAAACWRCRGTEEAAVTLTVTAEQGIARDSQVSDPVTGYGSVDPFCSLAFEGVGSR
jgi:hypothetical protein